MKGPMYLPSMSKRAQTYYGIFSAAFFLLMPFVFISVLDWHPVFFRIFSIFLMSATVILFFAYGALMRYPSPEKVGQYPKEMRAEISGKRKVLQPYVRILLLALSIGIAWGFWDFFKDIGLLLIGRPDVQTVAGKITSVETVEGTASLCQYIQLDGDTDISYAYFYNFHPRFTIGQRIEVTVLKYSRTIIEDRLD